MLVPNLIPATILLISFYRIEVRSDIQNLESIFRKDIISLNPDITKRQYGVLQWTKRYVLDQLLPDDNLLDITYKKFQH